MEDQVRESAWVTIPGFEDYQITLDGDIRYLSKSTNVPIRSIRTRKNDSGEEYVLLHKDNGYVKKYVDELLELTFDK